MSPSPDEMELANIEILEEPVHFRPKWLSWIPYEWFRRLKKNDYRRRGLGTELLKLVIEIAREKNVACIQGIVTRQGIAENPKLLEWYEEHGFEVIPVAAPGANTSDAVASFLCNMGDL